MKIYLGDARSVLQTLRPNSVDALVTDPPAGISFMGKEWDGDKGGRDQWIAWLTDVMRRCFDVMKPGAHGLVWALPRTSHWTATALENAGFEVRDVVTHLFGTGFPKSLDISKAIDKAAGAQRTEKVRQKHQGAITNEGIDEGWQRPWRNDPEKLERSKWEFAPATDDAKKWAGFGTALKPASEHWILVRKPLAKGNTVAANVLQYGTGGLNIDASRIEAADQHVLDAAVKRMTGNSVRGNCTDNFVSGSKSIQPKSAQGRFPANLVLSHAEECHEEACLPSCAVAMLDAQSGTLVSGSRRAGVRQGRRSTQTYGDQIGDGGPEIAGSSGGASRFFYCAKASKADKNAGLDGMPEREPPGSKRSKPAPGRKSALGAPRANFHPTVKSTALMEYLIRLITPPGGTVLDPFMGSGSTGVAAKRVAANFIGVELDPEYFQIAKVRLEAHGQG